MGSSRTPISRGLQAALVLAGTLTLALPARAMVPYVYLCLLYTSDAADE